MNSFQTVIDFWFSELKPAQWWYKDAAIDQIISQRFSSLHASAIANELQHWRNQALGRLAEIIILDQFSRNLYRGSAKAYAADEMALCLAQQAIALKVHESFSANQKAFLYIPYMHSECWHIHEQAMILFSEPGLEQNLRSEIQHKAIIDRFGRYPHRNEVLGRVSSPEEIKFLKQPGSSF